MKLKLLLLVSLAFAFGCKQAPADASDVTDIEETAQQVGDVMASVDEAGGNTGTIAKLENFRSKKTFDRFAPGNFPQESVFATLLLPKSEATACSSGFGGYGSCVGHTMVRSFNGCTIGTAVLSGDVTLSWNGSGTVCTLGNGTPQAGDNITRSPNFTLTGRRNATLSVTKSGSVGQTLTYVSGSGSTAVFNFTNDGIRRKFSSGATILFDETTTVVSATSISITGNSRSNRVMSGGFLTVTNNLNSVICNFSPSNVTWNSSSCNCPTQGTWSGSCSNGKSTSLVLNGCGTANYSEGTTTTPVTFDRCGT